LNGNLELFFKSEEISDDFKQMVGNLMMCVLEKADAGWTIDDLNDYLNGKIGARIALLPSDIKYFLIKGFSELI